MYYITAPSPLGALPLPPVSEGVAFSLRGYTSALCIPAAINPQDVHPALDGMAFLPSARLLLGATDTRPPELGPECLAIAQAVDCDILLIRRFGQFDHLFAAFAAHPARPDRRIQFEHLRLGITWETGATLSPDHEGDADWQITKSGLRPHFVKRKAFDDAAFLKGRKL